MEDYVEYFDYVFFIVANLVPVAVYKLCVSDTWLVQHCPINFEVMLGEDHEEVHGKIEYYEYRI